MLVRITSSFITNANNYWTYTCPRSYLLKTSKNQIATSLRVSNEPSSVLIITEVVITEFHFFVFQAKSRFLPPLSPPKIFWLPLEESLRTPMNHVPTMTTSYKSISALTIPFPNPAMANIPNHKSKHGRRFVWYS